MYKCRVKTQKVVQSRQSLINTCKQLREREKGDNPKVMQQGHETRTGSPLTYNGSLPRSKRTRMSEGG